jgi:hypothetical protein
VPTRFCISLFNAVLRGRKNELQNEIYPELTRLARISDGEKIISQCIKVEVQHQTHRLGMSRGRSFGYLARILAAAAASTGVRVLQTDNIVID